MNDYLWSNEDKHLLVNWINDNRHYFFDDYFDSIVRFRTCIEQTQFSKSFTISDVEYAWNQLKNEGEKMAIEYKKQLEDANSECLDGVYLLNVINYRYVQWMLGILVGNEADLRV